MYVAEPQKTAARKPASASASPSFSSSSGPVSASAHPPIPDVLHLDDPERDAGPADKPFPHVYENSATKRIFRIAHAGRQVTATQIQGDPDDPHSGMARYSFAGNGLVLEHIESDPEEGSGIGALLMFSLAQIALENDKPVIDIAMPAATAVGFYEKMGAASVDPDKAARYNEALQQDEQFLEDRAQLYVRERARIGYNADPENRRFKKRSIWSSAKTRLEFSALSQSEQTKLIDAEKRKFRGLPRERRYEIAREMARQSAVSRTIGMRATTWDVLARASASMSKRIDGTPLWNDLT